VPFPNVSSNGDRGALLDAAAAVTRLAPYALDSADCCGMPVAAVHAASAPWLSAGWSDASALRAGVEQLAVTPFSDRRPTDMRQQA